MESFEDFNIKNPKYKKVEDLPRAVKPAYVNSGEGFITLNAAENDQRVERNAYEHKVVGENPKSHPYNPKDILYQEALEERDNIEGLLEDLRKKAKKGIDSFYKLSTDKSDPKGVEKKKIAHWVFMFRDNVSFFKEAVTIMPDILSQATREVKNNKEVALAAVSTLAESISEVSPALQRNKDVVMAALSQNPDLDPKYIKEATLDQIISGES